jgi:hypothetical protein
MNRAQPAVNGRISTFMGERTLGRISVLVFALVALLAAAGASRFPDGILLGTPTLVATALALAATWVVGLRPVEGRRALLGLAVVPALLILVPRTAAAGALSGPPLIAIVAAGLISVGVPWGRLRLLFVPVVLALYLAVSLGVQQRVGPQGDEPHYLMVAESLLRDHDVSLEQDYREERYRAFFKGGTLAPHFRVRGPHGEIYSLHAVGLSVLILPVYALAGYAGASVFMALLAVAAAVAIRSLLRATSEQEEEADAVAWIVALSPPLVHFAGLVFTEVPAALITAIALREGLRAREISVRRAAAVAVAIAFLPWLNVRYAIVAGLLWAYWAWMRPRRAVLLVHLSAAVATAIGVMAYHHALYGFFDPRRVYGREREFSMATLGSGLPGLLLDQEFGLLAYAPVFVLAVPGLVKLIARRSRVGTAGAALVAVVFLVAAAWPMWRGGFNPPARFLVPVVPALALGISAWIGDRRSAATALLVGWGLFTGLAGAGDPALVHRDRDVTAPLFRAEAGATEWTRLLPRYVLLDEEPNRRRTGLALVWAGVLAVAVWRSRKPLRPYSLAGGIAFLAAAAQIAAQVSDARAGGREAVHVVGRTALAFPPGRIEPATVGRWTATDLSWGPVYEPHRHSGTAQVGERLPLRPRSYRLSLIGDVLGGAGIPPAIVLIAREGRPIGRASCGAEARGWSCLFEVPVGTPEVTLTLEGGSPFAIKEIQLALNLQPRSSV